MSAQLVVKKGIRWRVGNGKSIQIWSDDWLPSCSYPRILSPAQAQWVSAKVSDLIVEDRGEWNLSVVRHLFNPVEADLVMSIPLSQRLPVDRVVWGVQEMENSRFAATTTASVRWRIPTRKNALMHRR